VSFRPRPKGGHPARSGRGRNIITHDYAAVKNNMIWAIVINHLPKLKSEAEELLKK